LIISRTILFHVLYLYALIFRYPTMENDDDLMDVDTEDAPYIKHEFSDTESSTSSPTIFRSISGDPIQMSNNELICRLSCPYGTKCTQKDSFNCWYMFHAVPMSTNLICEGGEIDLYFERLSQNICPNGMMCAGKQRQQCCIPFHPTCCGGRKSEDDQRELIMLRSEMYRRVFVKQVSRGTTTKDLICRLICPHGANCIHLRSGDCWFMFHTTQYDLSQPQFQFGYLSHLNDEAIWFYLINENICPNGIRCKPPPGFVCPFQFHTIYSAAGRHEDYVISGLLNYKKELFKRFFVLYEKF
jgi:hypothetical protein